MDLRQLRQFVTVAEELNFRKAAQRLHMSQPPLSAAIQRLERDLGTTLLERTRHFVRLTAAGEAFVDEARRTLVQAQLSIEAAQRAARGMVGTLRLSFVPSVAYGILPQLLRAFRADCPNVRLILTGEPTARQLEWLRQQSVDLAIVVPPLADTRGLRIQRLAEEALVLAVPSNHALGARRRVRLSALANEDFVGMPLASGPGFVGEVLGACQKAGFIPRQVQEAPQMQTLVALVAGGAGVAFVPASMRSVQLANVTYVDVQHAGQSLRYPLGLASHASGSNPVAAAFCAVADRWQTGQWGRRGRDRSAPVAVTVPAIAPPAGPKRNLQVTSVTCPWSSQ